MTKSNEGERPMRISDITRSAPVEWFIILAPSVLVIGFLLVNSFMK